MKIYILILLARRRPTQFLKIGLAYLWLTIVGPRPSLGQLNRPVTF